MHYEVVLELELVKENDSRLFTPDPLNLCGLYWTDMIIIPHHAGTQIVREMSRSIQLSSVIT